MSNPYEGMTRAKWLRWWLDALRRQRKWAPESVRALEVGRIRSKTETTGHSTLHIVRHPAIRELVTIDVNDWTRAVTLDVVPPAYHHRLTFIDGNAIEWLAERVAEGEGKFEFMYLDGPNNADACYAIFMLAVGVAKPNAIIILDDANVRRTEKCKLIRPYIDRHPDLFEIKHEVPADKTCHGLLVIEVK